MDMPSDMNTGPKKAASPIWPVAQIGGKLPRKVNYYQVHIDAPMDPETQPYFAECADIIEALGMTFNEGEAFKALWRLAAQRSLGITKGNKPKYDADKAAHYAARVAAQEAKKENNNV